MDKKINGWNENDSEQFLKYGKVLIPYRKRAEKIFIELIATESRESMTVVDICVGGGWLTESILKNFPRASVIAVDGSEKMLHYTKNRLKMFEDRLSLQKINLHDEGWLESLGKVDYFVSSLAIHHLDDDEKQSLFKRLYHSLTNKGKFICLDIVKPESELSRIIFAREWDDIVKEQSQIIHVNLEAYEFFINEQWNLFYYPDDPFDKPSTLFDQIEWMKIAGFKNVELLFFHAGHALFAGEK